MHPSLFDLPWAGTAGGAGKTGQAHGGQGICHACGRWHIRSNGSVELNAIAILNFIWAHLDYVDVVFEQEFLEVSSTPNAHEIKYV